MSQDQPTSIAIVGLGYVGLPLAVLFSKKHPVIGFDIKWTRINRINACHDDGGEVESEKLREALVRGIKFTYNVDDIKDCNVYIVAVPTPIDRNNIPDLTPLQGASFTVGEVIKPGDYVVFESTVYPGTTEEVCVPIMEKISGLKLNKDFYVGYSPERINPGDKVHTVENIVKITSGSTPEAADFIDALYNSVLLNGTYRAQSIQVAEAAKIIENAQRDVNIAFINEAAKIFNVLGINTNDVISAASTKWNFQTFRPGLVGGHCISVDPYYLIQRAESKGFTPTLINEARRINATMGHYVAERVTSELNMRGVMVRESKILILGFTFKENCNDIRNTKVEDVYRALKSYTKDVFIFDPVVDKREVLHHYNIEVFTELNEVPAVKYDAIIQCVNHRAFADIDLKSMLADKGFIFYVNEPKPHVNGSTIELAL